MNVRQGPEDLSAHLGSVWFGFLEQIRSTTAGI
jgi:hypothetical protein